jgi:hypothetical protein
MKNPIQKIAQVLELIILIIQVFELNMYQFGINFSEAHRIEFHLLEPGKNQK